MIERVYRCGDCGEIFSTLGECVCHADIHVDDNVFVCDKCGKEYKFKPTHIGHDYPDTNILHSFNNGIAGYGSKLDGTKISFNICDDCLVELLKTFTTAAQDRIFNEYSLG